MTFLLILFLFFTTLNYGYLIDGYSIPVHNSVPGCYHNGTLYDDGSLVPTMEPCLSCKCINRTLICGLRMCPEQPIPPPRGCILVHNKASCCSHLSCRRLNKRPSSEHDRRVISYLDEYENEQKQQDHRLYISNHLRRSEDDLDETNDLCVQNGTVYKSGSAMSSSSLCSYCYCIAGKQKCVKPKCLLPSPGCEPIFIDANCCPIKYDCSGNNSSKKSTSAAPNYVKRIIGNRHYMRNVTRSQRSRGCLIDSYFYPEGQKIPTDSEHPCDVCFCIRGTKQCTPKKCAPAIKNCLPMIPKGQCCPSSYSCNHEGSGSSHKQRDDHVEKARQFDFFSILFGLDENTTDIPFMESITEIPDMKISTTSEKSFLDAFRDGLDFIDANGDNIGTLLSSDKNTTDTVEVSSIGPPANKSNDLFELFGFNDNDNDYYDDDFAINGNDTRQEILNQEAGEIPSQFHTSVEINREEDKLKIVQETITFTTETTTSAATTTSPSGEDSTQSEKIEEKAVTESEEEELPVEIEYSQETTTSDESIENVEVVSTESGGITYSYETESTEVSEEYSESGETTTTSALTETVEPEHDASTTQLSTTTISEESVNYTESDAPPTTTTAASNYDEDEVTEQNLLIIHDVKEEISTTGAQNEDELLSITTEEPSHKIDNEPPNLVENSNDSNLNQGVINMTTENILSAFINGLASILEEDGLNTTTAPLNSTSAPLSITSTTPSPVPVSPKIVNHTKVAITESVPVLTPQPELPPLIINSNPSILETDYHYDYSEPTLPPSLPNLKIIPFLPADAVKNDRKKVAYDYYKLNPTIYPAITEKYDKYDLYNVDPTVFPNTDKYDAIFGINNDKRIDYSSSYANENFNRNNDHKGDFHVFPAGDKLYNSAKIDFDSYNPTAYPSITESFDGLKYQDRSDYDYGGDLKFPTTQEKYDTGTKNILHEKYNSEMKYLQSKYDSGLSYNTENSYSDLGGFEKFATMYPKYQNGPVYNGGNGGIEFKTDTPLFSYDQQMNLFSPPKKTEGGFLPREPNNDNFYYDTFHTTNFVIDLTTEMSQKTNLTNLYVGITSPDPFKNVIRTESPPDLHSLIEDKEKLLINRVIVNESDYDHDIISITTDKNDNTTSEYVDFRDKIVTNLESDNGTDNVPNIKILSNVLKNIEEQPNRKNLSSGTLSFIKNETIPPATTSKPDSFFDGLFGFLFKDNEPLDDDLPKLTTMSPAKLELPETVIIPEFKNISSDLPIFLSNITSLMGENQAENSTIIRNFWLDLLGENYHEYSDEDRVKLSSMSLVTLTTTTTTTPISTSPLSPSVAYHLYSKPYLSPALALKPEDIDSKYNDGNNYNPIRSSLASVIPEFQKEKIDRYNYNPDGYQVLPEDSIISNTESYVINPVDLDKLKQHHSEGPAEIITKPVNSIKDPVGVLKLAGCNIYGRMYRVGKIISELSGPCLECKCTDVGVHCTPLGC